MSFSADPLRFLVKSNKDFLNRLEERRAQIDQEAKDFYKEFVKCIESVNCDSIILNGIDQVDSSKASKENAPKENNANFAVPSTKRRGRPKKSALADITDINETITNFKIKKEKISEGSTTSTISAANSDIGIVEVKKEMQEMVPPTKRAPRKKVKTESEDVPKRSTRTRTRNLRGQNEVNEEVVHGQKNSDVILQNTTITTIELSDDPDKEWETDSGHSTGSQRSTRSKVQKLKIKQEPGLEVTRSTRTKTIRKNKRARSSSNEGELETEQKKSKSKDEGIDSPTESNETTRKQPQSQSETDSNDIQPQNSKSNSVKKLKNSKQKVTSQENQKEVQARSVSTTRKNDSMKAKPSPPVGKKETEKSENSMSVNQKKPQRSASNNIVSEPDCNITGKTVYEDALSGLETKNPDATFVASSNHSKKSSENGSALNSTVIVENPKVVTKNKEKAETNTPPKAKNKTTGKPMFSPYEKTPLKKKVEAFERLGATSNIPKRTTRTKTRGLPKEEGKEDEAATDVDEPMVKEKPKTFTPLAAKFMPKSCSTSKAPKLFPSASDMSANDSLLSLKSSSALKVSQAEFRERERRRQEKEREALRKREALLLAQTEEKRRKNEEKQLKAQQQREVLEKEKLKQLEAQKIKDEKYKQAMAEREEKLLKQKEEAEKKRANAKKKAIEHLKEKERLLREEEQRKNAEMKQDRQKEMILKHKRNQEQQQLDQPIYLTTKLPRLPCEDCYDSDEPEYHTIRPRIPDWSKDREINRMQRLQIVAGETIKNSLFCRQAHTPDLRDIFQIIDPKKLKRTSSAIWRAPPRYTLMPGLENADISEDSS